jgi:pimeloyl-ACP methyl ester carboxylesterase
MGGQIAQIMAADRPDDVSKLILINPVPASGIPIPDEVGALFRSAGGDADKRAAVVDMSCKQLDAEARQRLLDVSEFVPEAMVQATYDAFTAGGFADRLAAITAPTVVLATSDAFLPPAFLQAAVVDPIANATLITLEGPGHYPMAERPADTIRLILDALP